MTRSKPRSAASTNEAAQGVTTDSIVKQPDSSLRGAQATKQSIAQQKKKKVSWIASLRSQ
jgi:hypothetical protein